MKRDIGLLLIGMCFGIFLCSVGMFLIVANSGNVSNTPTPVSSITNTFVPTRTNTSTVTITPFPILDSLGSETYTPTKVPYITPIPTIKVIPTKKSNNNQTYPVGVTAICKDGTYSYSQTSSGTCSHHGGVKKWIHKP